MRVHLPAFVHTFADRVGVQKLYRTMVKFVSVVGNIYFYDLRKDRNSFVIDDPIFVEAAEKSFDQRSVGDDAVFAFAKSCEMIAVHIAFAIARGSDKLAACLRRRF